MTAFETQHEKAPLPRRRRWLRRLLALGLSLAVSLVLVELVFRVKFGAPPAERLPIVRVQANPHRGWEMVPGEPHFTYHHKVSVNALGLRGPEIGAKAPGEMRVLALGDSLIYGQGVADDETVPHYLEQFLAESDPEQREWTVINAGHRAYGTNQELGLLRELGPELAPDVVVLFWFWNDFGQRDIEATHARLLASGPIAFDVGEPMEGLAKLKWHAIQLVRKSAFAMTLHDKRRAGAPFPFEQYQRDGLPLFGPQLDELLELAERDGFRPVFAVVPDSNEIRHRHPTERIGDEASALAAERGIPVVRLLSSVRELARETGDVPTIPYDGHYSPDGNRALARQTADELGTLLWGAEVRR